MSNSPGRLSFDFAYRVSPDARPAPPEAVANVLLIADFSGRANRNVCEPVLGRKCLAVDVDNFESAPGRFRATLQLAMPGAAGGLAALEFGSLDDFHPDSLLRRCPALAELLEARHGLDASATAAEASEKLQRLLSAVVPTSAPAPAATAAPQSPESAEATLARLLGKTPASPSPQPAGGSSAQAFIRQIVASSSSTAPALPAGIAGLKTAAELELASNLRRLLHHRDFQALEAAWRGVDFLVRRCPDEERVKLFLLDASLAELAADLAGLERLLRERRWAFVAGDFVFGATRGELEVLLGLARICAAHGCAFLAGAHPQLVDCDSFAAHPDPDDWKRQTPEEIKGAWQALRNLPESAHVGLALPRFLLRQPYGANSDPIHGFGFTEILDPANHDAYLWGNSAILCAQLLAEALCADEESGELIGSGDVGELPVFRFTQNSERGTLPCGEAWLSDRAAEAILDRGLIPVLSIKGRDAVRVVNVRSIAQPARALAVGR
jgi:type VI secretion system protein ImpC